MSVLNLDQNKFMSIFFSKKIFITILFFTSLITGLFFGVKVNAQTNQQCANFQSATPPEYTTSLGEAVVVRSKTDAGQCSCSISIRNMQVPPTGISTDDCPSCHGVRRNLEASGYRALAGNLGSIAFPESGFACFSFTEAIQKFVREFASTIGGYTFDEGLFKDNCSPILGSMPTTPGIGPLAFQPIPTRVIRIIPNANCSFINTDDEGGFGCGGSVNQVNCELSFTEDGHGFCGIPTLVEQPVEEKKCLDKEWIQTNFTYDKCGLVNFSDQLFPDFWFDVTCKTVLEAVEDKPVLSFCEDQTQIDEVCKKEGEGTGEALTKCREYIARECEGLCPKTGERPGLLGCDVGDSIANLNKLKLGSGTKTEQIQTLVGKIIEYILGFTGSVALAMFVGSGFMWMTARGNSEKTSKALKMMTWSSLGVVVILSSYVILKFIFGLFV